jgi:four helix bundle protein
MRDYTKITAWAAADELTLEVYRHTKPFPAHELYGLTSQMRRASFSVPSNIAEGASRKSKKEFLHFLRIAHGSLSETQYFIHLAFRLGYLTPASEEALRVRTTSSFKCLYGLIRAVEAEVEAEQHPTPSLDRH